MRAPHAARRLLLCLVAASVGEPLLAADATVAALLGQARAQQQAGAYEDAVVTLRGALPVAEASGDLADQAAVRAALGAVLGVCPRPSETAPEVDAARKAALAECGRPARALEQLDRARELARQAKAPALEAMVEINRGNLLAAAGGTDEALAAHAAAERLAREAADPPLAARALANAARTRFDAGRPPAEVRPDLDAALALVGSAPAAPTDLRLHLARTAELLAERSSAAPDDERAHKSLDAARSSARERGDAVSESWALGTLGRLYEVRGRTGDALAITRRAILLAEQGGAPEALYRWQGQIGRLNAAEGKTCEALDSYRAAVVTIGTIREELLRSYGAGVSFRNDVSPIYVGLADLLLRTPAGSCKDDKGQPPGTDTLALEARETVEQLKKEELRDYFRDECVDQLAKEVKPVDRWPRTAVIYPVILPDRLEILITLESSVLRKTVPRDEATLAAEVRQLRLGLETKTTREYLEHAQRMYDLLVRPWISDLEPQGVDTLVFVPDGPLRTIPMAALHDGEKFLIERYAVAVTPGLQLTDPRPLTREAPHVLLAGVSKSIRDFPALPSVPGELEGIQSQVGGDLLLDEAFQSARVEQELAERDFNIVHVASHANFGAESADSGVQAYDRALSFDEIGKLVGFKRFSEQPIELLALSACETAQGSDRAALGLAGLAVKAGARSALGTLWSVNDASTSELMQRFYEALGSPEVSKAEALRSAQRSLLADGTHRHPYYWSPFLLINNWL